MKTKTLNAFQPGRALATVVVSLAAGLAVPLPASAAGAAAKSAVVTCSARTLRGVYEFRASGYTLVNGAAVPKAIIETLVFDGKGNVQTPHVSISFNGNIVQPPMGASGIYSVDANCKGTLTFADAGTVSFDLHVHPAGKSVAMLQTNAGNVMQGEAVRVLSLGAWAG
ncbi:MAG TPA: hypothetical protein VFM30_01160 [Steroidobacteraceae bacterium]|nr:hypothetical protein [Steroidobacteraceae bacterium]